ncbi:MAG: GTP 3',8-cyclase MoaA [Planctomycetota bacterium]
MLSQCTTQSVLTLRISVTDRCNLRCRYCMPAGGIPLHSHNEILSLEEIMQVVRAARDSAGDIAVRLTGGEPLLRRNITDLVAMLDAEGVKDIALTTNGQRLAAMAGELKRAGLQRVNISLDSLQPELFAWMTRGGNIDKTVEGIDAAMECNLSPVKLNAVILRGINDHEVCDLAYYAVTRGCAMRFIELMPIGESRVRHGKLYVSTSEIEGRLKEEFEFEAQHSWWGSAARTFAIQCLTTGVRGTIGFISSVSHPFCNSCRRLRLTRHGELIGCLLRNEGVDLRSMIRSGTSQVELQQVIQEALDSKVMGRDPNICSRTTMAVIGG